MTRYWNAARMRLEGDEDGQTMAEYAVVLAVITAAIIATFGVLAGGIEAALQNAADVVGGG